VALGAVCGSVYGFERPRGITSDEDFHKLERWHTRWDRPRNSYDTTSLATEFKQKVRGDPRAEEGMALFIDCKYWHLVDHCEDYLPNMIPDNAQLFSGVIVLLAPWLDIGDYTQRIKEIIENPLSITPDYFQHRILLYKMFFYGAVECGKRDYTWIMIETCASICDELRVLASEFEWPELAQFDEMDVRDAAYGGRLTEDRLSGTAAHVWPNLGCRNIT
jgi:hypothetical protein